MTDTNDIVEQLLKWTESGSEGDVITQFYIDMHEAADLIEQQRALLTRTLMVAEYIILPQMLVDDIRAALEKPYGQDK